jgi:hypothetical protein
MALKEFARWRANDLALEIPAGRVRSSLVFGQGRTFERNVELARCGKTGIHAAVDTPGLRSFPSALFQKFLP